MVLCTANHSFHAAIPPIQYKNSLYRLNNRDDVQIFVCFRSKPIGRSIKFWRISELAKNSNRTIELKKLAINYKFGNVGVLIFYIKHSSAMSSIF